MARSRASRAARRSLEAGLRRHGPVSLTVSEGRLLTNRNERVQRAARVRAGLRCPRRERGAKRQVQLGACRSRRTIGNGLGPARSWQHPVANDRSSDLPRDALRGQIVNLCLADVYLDGKRPQR